MRLKIQVLNFQMKESDQKCLYAMIWLAIIERTGLCFKITTKKVEQNNFFNNFLHFIFSFIHGSKKFDDYRFYHWGGIDIFVYFSHHYVTIPPISWINAGHRNGVPVLGTIIIEFDAAKHLLDGLLRSKHDTNRYVEALVLVTKNFGFDGWLLNIECRADREQVPLLKAFTRQLTARIHEEIPNGIVLWYDSVTEAGKLDWQNEVNEKNIDMYKDVSDGILLNYGWSMDHLQRTIDILKRDQVEMAKVFVGVDVFGRSHVAGFYTHEVSPLNF